MSWNELPRQASEWRAKGLWRELREVKGRSGVVLTATDRRGVVSFASNDYLGLAASPWLAQQLSQAALECGAGAGASRLICGSHQPHHELEERLALFKHSQAALSFSSGYATAMGVIPALVGRGDTVILDRLAHACLIDATRLSGASLRVFAHQDLDKLESCLRRAQGRVLIVTESVFSMDGDLAPLREIVELKNRYGAWLLLDEAHAVGVLGPEGRGLAARESLSDQVELQMGTMGKALGLSGGYVAASRQVIDWLVNRARSAVFSTAPPPALARAACAVLGVVQSSEGQRLRQRLFERMAQWSALSGIEPHSAIVPWGIGAEERAVSLAQSLQQDGLWVPAIRYPTVGRGEARLRISLSAAHEPSHLQDLWSALKRLTP